MNTTLKPKKALLILLSIIGVLFIGHTIGLVARIEFSHGHLLGFGTLFDFDREQNLPTYFSTFVLLSCAILLFVIANSQEKANQHRMYWFGLAAIFVFLSVDEFALIHERFFELGFRKAFSTSGLFYTAWVIPYGAALLLFGILYLRFFFALPKSTRILFAVSGILYVSGAIGFEMFGGQQKELHGQANWLYASLATTEELLEMTGASTFVYALLRHIKEHFERSMISIKLTD